MLLHVHFAVQIIKTVARCCIQIIYDRFLLPLTLVLNVLVCY